MMSDIINEVARTKLPVGVWDSLPDDVQHETIFKARSCASSITVARTTSII